MAATFAAVALAARAETAHQPVSALRPVRGSMRWCAGPDVVSHRRRPWPLVASPPSVIPIARSRRPGDLVVRADDPARRLGDDPQVAPHVRDHVESELVGDPLGNLVSQPGLGRRPEVEGDPRGDAHPPRGDLDLAPRARVGGMRRRRVQDRDVAGGPGAVASSIHLAAEARVDQAARGGGGGQGHLDQLDEERAGRGPLPGGPVDARDLRVGAEPAGHLLEPVRPRTGGSPQHGGRWPRQPSPAGSRPASCATAARRSRRCS